MATTSDHNLLIVSDLHLSEGFHPRTGKLSSNEDFLSDDSFARFLEFQNANRKKKLPWKLIIAGDVFDFLQVTTPSSISGSELSTEIKHIEARTGIHAVSISDPQARRAEATELLNAAIDHLSSSHSEADKRLIVLARRLKSASVGLRHDFVWSYENLVLETWILAIKRNAELSKRESKYGLGTSWYESVRKINRIAEGHPAFFEGLAWFIDKGNSVVMMKGNHDIELYWPQVQERVRILLANSHLRLTGNGSIIPNAFGNPDLSEVEFREILHEQITFTPWIYYEPGTVYIEHGNQYEVLDAFEDFLAPILPKGRPYLRLPPGSHFVRYFFNSIEKVFPFADNLRPISRSLSWTFSKHFLTTVGLLISHWGGAWFAARMLMTRGIGDFLFTQGQDRLLSRVKRGKIRKASRKLRILWDTDYAHALGLEATSVGPLTPDRLFEIEERARKQRSEGPDKIRKWLTILMPIGFFLLVVVGVLLVFLVPVLWPSISRILRVSPVTIIAIGFLLFAGAGIIAKLLSAIIHWRVSKAKDYLLEAAEGVSKIIEPSDKYGESAAVKYLVFGHTHHPDMVLLEDGNSWYVNTGSWLSTVSEVEEWSRLDRDFSFLEIIPDDFKGPPRLFRWNPNSQFPEQIRLRIEGG